MSLSPINFNGMIQNTAEVGNIKAQEDARPEVNQSNMQAVFNQEEEHESRSVNQLEEKTNQYDLGDGKGNGGYQGGKKKKKKREEEKKSDGVVKKKDGHVSFDMSV
ncbi:MAG: hypothetical protein K5644_03095 [Lachnospiraceae bacterium]|nr:hypothetical protein [Lachnospiraceae bacterium]